MISKPNVSFSMPPAEFSLEPVQLLVSVRSAAEAHNAIDGGADWIDVKEPANGALGAASPETVAAIVEAVGSRRPVSAALGELRDLPQPAIASWDWLDGVAIAKVGLSGCKGDASWKRKLADLGQQLPSSVQLIAVLYADARLCHAPGADEVLSAAVDCGCPALLVDTYLKDRGRLLDHLGVDDLRRLFHSARDRGIWPVAAGSLQASDLVQVLQANPALIAVRGAVCRGGRRDGEVSMLSVARLRQALSDELGRIS